MPKLNQIVAVVNGKKSEVQRALTEVYRKCKSAELFNGLTRKYTPRDDEGEKLPDENKVVMYTVDQALADFKENFASLVDVVAVQDYNNGRAVADVVVDGKVVLKDVPVTYLLFLEKQLIDLNTFIASLPTLDVAETWTLDENRDVYVSMGTKSARTKKELRHKVLYEATDKHPAQIEKWTEDVPVGDWLTTKLSGAMPLKEKKSLAEKVKKLQDAVKFARENANSIEIEKVEVAENLFNYLNV